ncbi:MAG: 50S ribosomal protein L25 [Calditrichia bacterium]
MSEVIVKASKRDQIGKGYARKYRSGGLIPAEFYSAHDDNKHLLVNGKEFETLLSHSHGLLTLEVEGEKKQVQCIVKDLQHHPINGSVLHVDFQGVKQDEKITIDVPLVLKGTAPGVKAGGILEHLIRELQVECFPRDIPERIEIEIAGLEIGDSIQVKDLEHANFRILDDPEETIVMVEHARVAKEEEAEEELLAEEPQEPEVIRGRKEEEED